MSGVSISPLQAAWSAFDAAALKLRGMYDPKSESWNDPVGIMKATIEALRLWDEWRALSIAAEASDARQ